MQCKFVQGHLKMENWIEMHWTPPPPRYWWITVAHWPMREQGCAASVKRDEERSELWHSPLTTADPGALLSWPHTGTWHPISPLQLLSTQQQVARPPLIIFHINTIIHSRTSQSGASILDQGWKQSHRSWLHTRPAALCNPGHQQRKVLEFDWKHQPARVTSHIYCSEDVWPHPSPLMCEDASSVLSGYPWCPTEQYSDQSIVDLTMQQLDHCHSDNSYGVRWHRLLTVSSNDNF